MDTESKLISSDAAKSVDSLNRSQIMDLHIQRDEAFPDQSALMEGSDQHDVKLPDQSNGRDSPAESGEMMDQSEDSAKDIHRLSDSGHQSSSNTNNVECVSANKGDNLSTSSNDDVTDPNVESSPMIAHLHDPTVAKQAEVNSSGGTMQSRTKYIDETMSPEQVKECKDDQIQVNVYNCNIHSIDAQDDGVSVLENSQPRDEQDASPVDMIDNKYISRLDSNARRTEIIQESNTLAANDAHSINGDMKQNLDKGDFSLNEENNISNSGGPSESPKHSADYGLRYSNESDCENKTAQTTNNSRIQSPRFFRPISPGFRSNTPTIQSNQAGPSIQVTNQSEGSASSLNEGGINQDEPNRDGSEASYQRDESSNSLSEEDEPLKEPSKLTKSQVLTFFSLAISIFLDQVSFSVLAPFFPREAKERGVSSLQTGFIFGAFALVNVIFSPIFGKFLPRLGAKFTFVSGIWIVAGCNILFGFCDEITSTSMFVIFCYVVRGTAALGTAAAVTASFTIAAQTFPDHVAQTIGLMETFGGLGYMVGPVIGGFLYEVGGQDYKIPFIVLGCADLVCVFLNLALLPPIVSEDRKTGSITQFLSIPSVWPVGLVIFVGSASFGFLDPTLSLHVEQFTESAMVVGLLFLLAGGSYALSSPVWGWIAEKLNISRLMVIIGTIMSGGAFLLMGPSPHLNLPHELWIICLSLFLCGVFLSASVICSFNDYLLCALKHDLPDDMSTQAVVSGIFNSLLALGNFVGPSIGGLVVHLYGFDWSVTVIGGIQVAVAIILALFTMVEFCYHQRRRPTPLSTRVMASVNQEDLVQDSIEPLLKGRV